MSNCIHHSQKNLLSPGCEWGKISPFVKWNWLRTMSINAIWNRPLGVAPKSSYSDNWFRMYVSSLHWVPHFTCEMQHRTGPLSNVDPLWSVVLLTWYLVLRWSLVNLCQYWICAMKEMQKDESSREWANLLRIFSISAYNNVCLAWHEHPFVHNKISIMSMVGESFSAYACSWRVLLVHKHAIFEVLVNHPCPEWENASLPKIAKY